MNTADGLSSLVYPDDSLFEGQNAADGFYNFASGAPSLMDISISIPSFELVDGDNGTPLVKFCVSVASKYALWEVRRQYISFMELDQDLRKMFPHSVLPEFPIEKLQKSRRHSANNFNSFCNKEFEKRRSCLETYLRDLVLVNEVWISSRFIQFLDDAPAPSLGVQIQVEALSNQVNSLRNCCYKLEQKLETAESTIYYAVSVIQQMQSDRGADMPPPPPAATANGKANVRQEHMLNDGDGMEEDTMPDRYANSIQLMTAHNIKLKQHRRISWPLCWPLTHALLDMAGVANADAGDSEILDILPPNDSIDARGHMSPSMPSNNALTAVQVEQNMRFYPRRKSHTLDHDDFTLNLDVENVADSSKPEKSSSLVADPVVDPNNSLPSPTGSMSLGTSVPASCLDSPVTSKSEVPSLFTQSLMSLSGGQRKFSIQSDGQSVASVEVALGGSPSLIGQSLLSLSNANLVPPLGPEAQPTGTENESPSLFGPTLLSMGNSSFLTLNESAPSDSTSGGLQQETVPTKSRLKSIWDFSADNDVTSEAPLGCPTSPVLTQSQLDSKVENDINFLMKASGAMGAISADVDDHDLDAMFSMDGNVPTANFKVSSPEYLSDGTVPTLENNPMLLPLYNGACEQIIEMICQCNRPWLPARTNVTAFISKYARKACTAKAFTIGASSSLKCLLPDDPVDITLILWKGSKTNWHYVLQEYFVKLSACVMTHRGGNPDHLQRNLSKLDNGGIEWDELNEDLNQMSLSLRNFSCFISADEQGDELGDQQLNLFFDNTRINLTANGRKPLCLAAFVEEFAVVVGKDELFKKSLLLIRSWWMYEAPTYISGDNGNNTSEIVHSCLSENSIMVMLCAVLNLHHSKLDFPIQVLAAFLAEYGRFDWDNYAVSILGRVLISKGVTPEGVDCPYTLPTPMPTHLISVELLHKYHSMFDANLLAYASITRNHSTASLQELVRDETADASSLRSSINEDKEGAVNFSPTAFKYVSGVEEDYCHIVDIGEEATAGGVQPSTIDIPNPPLVHVTPVDPMKFRRAAINILHPLQDYHNIITESMECTRQLDIVKDVFRIAGQRLGSAISRISQNIADTQAANSSPSKVFNFPASFHAHNINIMFNSLFSSIVSKFGNFYIQNLPIIVKSLKLDNTVSPSMMESALAAQICPPEALVAAFVGPEVNRFDMKLVVENLAKVAMSHPVWFSSTSVSVETLWKRVQYSNLLLHGNVSSSAMRYLCMDILYDRGSVPVGEIGKLVQELTGSVSLSAILKDRYGGLKKFLEIYPHDFVISSNHPFNPHIYLRSALLPHELALVEKGETPASFMAKYKKKISRKKKPSANTFVNSGVPWMGGEVDMLSRSRLVNDNGSYVPFTYQKNSAEGAMHSALPHSTSTVSLSALTKGMVDESSPGGGKGYVSSSLLNNGYNDISGGTKPFQPNQSGGSRVSGSEGTFHESSTESPQTKSYLPEHGQHQLPQFRPLPFLSTMPPSGAPRPMLPRQEVFNHQGRGGGQARAYTHGKDNNKEVNYPHSENNSSRYHPSGVIPNLPGGGHPLQGSHSFQSFQQSPHDTRYGDPHQYPHGQSQFQPPFNKINRQGNQGNAPRTFVPPPPGARLHETYSRDQPYYQNKPYPSK